MLLLLYWFLMSIYAFILFGVDKARAKNNGRRIPEKKLLTVSALGGAIGSGLAMLIFHHKTKKERFTKKVPLFIALTVLVAAGCFYLNLHITVTEHEYVGADVPEELDGFRIVQVSDLHNQFFGFREKALIDRIADLSPDIIVVTGDVVDKNFTNYKLAYRFFEGAVKIAPVYYVTGNHEAWLSGSRLEKFLQSIEELGVIMMDNRKVTAGGLTIIGIADESLRRPPEELKNEDGFTICLAHEPMYHERYRALGADVAFVGHVHGGQVIIPKKGGVISPDLEFFPDLYAGAHVYGEGEDSMTMYISRGLGNSVLPLRINNYPELLVVTLRRQ